MNTRMPTVIAWLVSLAKLESSARVQTVKHTSTYLWLIFLIQWSRLKLAHMKDLKRSIKLIIQSRIEYLFKEHPSYGDIKRGGIYDLHTTLFRADMKRFFKGSFRGS